MKKLLLIICGAIIFLGAFAEVGDTFTKLSIKYMVTKEGTAGNEAAVTVQPANFSLTTVDIPDTVQNGSTKYRVTSIDKKALTGNTTITSVTFKANITVGDSAFVGCTNLKTITNSEKLKTVGKFAFAQTAVTDVNLTNAASIGEQAFAGCKALTQATIGASTGTIPYGLFYGCSALQTVSISDENKACTSIGENAFYECRLLNTIDLSKLMCLTSIGNDAFYDCAIRTVALPNSMTTIGYQAFYLCKSLSSISFKSGLQTIGNQAFYGCTALTEVNIPASVTSVGKSAFEGCSSIKNAVICSGNGSNNAPPSRADAGATIGNKAFYDCDALQTVVLGSTVTSIEDKCFNTDNKQALMNVYSNNPTPPTLGSYVFYGKNSDCQLHVPAGSEAAYNSSTWGEVFGGHIITGIDNINVDDNSNSLQGISEAGPNGAVRYFDLCGKPVRDISAPGLYIRQCGNKASKVLVK